MADTITVQDANAPHSFRREADGSVRLRIRFTPEEAALIEEAAGETPLLLYIHRVLGHRARYHVRKRAEVEAATGLADDDVIEDEDRDYEGVPEMGVTPVRFSRG